MEEAGSHSFSLTFDEESGKLHALFTPAPGAPLVDVAMVREAIRKGGWDKLHLDEAVIDDFVLECRKTDQTVDKIIGICRDGEFSLTVDSDLMTAWLTLVPPQGGKPVTLEMLGQALSEEGIVYGIDRPRIDAAFAAGHCERVAIAFGQPPKEGEPTRFETLYDKEDESSEEDDHERIRYADLCHITVVNPGDKLMLRIPPVQGKNGTNIRGQAILPKPTPDVPYRDSLQGAEPDKNNPNLLIATAGGQPVPAGNGVTVNPVIEVLDVDLSTGSIEFEGTLRVGGDVKAGMRIKVKGDVVVNGAMEAAEIIAGGNVAIRGGVVGHLDSRPGSPSLPETTARIICEGSVQAMFMEYAHVEAGKSILVDRSTRQCELIAREEIVVGKSGSKTGQIMGGKIQATQRIATSILGASTGMKTYVQAGVDPYLEKQIADKDQEFKKKCDEVDRIVKLLVYFKHNPQKGAGGVKEKVEATRQQLLASIDDLTAELKVLRGKLELAEQACVEVKNSIHYGVEVRIGQQTWMATDDMEGATLELQSGRIALNRKP